MDGKYIVVKEIPLGRGKSIKVDTEIDRVHGVFYMEGYLLTQDFQEDFNKLLKRELTNGWHYLKPVVTRIGKSIIEKQG